MAVRLCAKRKEEEQPANVQQQKIKKENKKIYIYSLEAASNKRRNILQKIVQNNPINLQLLRRSLGVVFIQNRMNREAPVQSSPVILTLLCEIPTRRTIAMHLGEMHRFLRF